MMNRGALVMIDALGVRGMWDWPEYRADPALIIARLQRQRRVVDEYIEVEIGGRAPIRSDSLLGSVVTMFLSDTILLGVTTKVPELPYEFALNQDDLDIVAVAIAAKWVSDILRIAASESPALNYRGCLTFGEFLLDGDRFCIGPAIDQAAAGHERANGAMVWLAKEAKDIVDKAEEKPGQEILVLPWVVPLKSSAAVPTYCVTPFSFLRTPIETRDQVQRMIASIERGGTAVNDKLANTAPFLAEAKRRSDGWNEQRVILSIPRARR